jgi:adenine specific DNA methylase Mod
MEKRLKLAKNLLKSTGVIFISIDDNEQAQLKLLCDEIFGETSFVAMFPWKKRTAKSDVPFGVSQEYEWILCYAKKDFMAGVSFERKYYETPDYPNNKWRLSDLTTQKLEADRPNSAFDLIDPKTGKKYPYNPKRLWGITKDTFQQYYAKGKIVFPDDYDFLNISIPSYRVFESEDKEKALKKYGSEMAMKAVSTFLPKEVGMSEDGNKDMIDIFNERLFSYPKPVSLIKHLIGVSTKTDAIILDFFAGSGTTGQAVLQQNKEDDGHRQFILCTNNENNICTEVCYPRIKKVIKGYKNSKNESVEGLNGNLKYYMCSFVEAEPTDRNKRKLVSESTEMLCIKENTFQLVLDENDFKVFKNDSDKYLGIIFYEDAIDLYKKTIKKINGHFNTYVFSLGDDPHEKQFSDVKDRVTLCAIPEVILKVYREIFK